MNSTTATYQFQHPFNQRPFNVHDTSEKTMNPNDFAVKTLGFPIPMGFFYPMSARHRRRSPLQRYALALPVTAELSGLETADGWFRLWANSQFAMENDPFRHL